MRTLPFIFAFFFVTSALLAQKTKEKTNLVKTVGTDKVNSVLFDFENESLHLKNWDDAKKATIRIRLEISANMPEPVMAQLVKANRYQIVGNLNEKGVYVLTMPNLEKKVSVGKVDLEDKLVVHISGPQDFFLEGNTLNRGSLLAGRNGGKSRLDTKRKLALKRQLLEEATENLEIVFIETSPATTASTVKSRVKPNRKKLNKKNARRHKMLETAAPMSLQQIKAQYGEVLIDGVVFEIE